MATSGFHFVPTGIGQLLRRGQLEVPPNQRSYAWRDKHVRNLLHDLNDAVTGGPSATEYFLGTIVLIDVPGKTPAIVDGQQRLATISIILARIRDYFSSLGRDGSARAIEEAFLASTDPRSEVSVPRLKLNDEDNEYYTSAVLPMQATGRDRTGKGATAPGAPTDGSCALPTWRGAISPMFSGPYQRGTGPIFCFGGTSL